MIRVKLQILSLILLSGFLCTADVMAQGRGRGGNSLLGLLSNEAVHKELEMSDEQIAEIENLMESSRDRRSKAMNKVRELFKEGGREAAMEMARSVFGDLGKEDEADVEDLLIGDQIDRLRQLSIQRELAGRNPGSALNKLLDLVEATDDEKKKFEKVKEKLEKEAAEKIAKIRSQIVEQIARQSLSSAKADEFMGFIGEAMEGGAGAFRDRGRGGWSGGDRGGRDGAKGAKGGKGEEGGNRGGDRPDGDDF